MHCVAGLDEPAGRGGGPQAHGVGHHHGVFGQVVQQPARRPVRRMHRTQEAPGLRQQLADSSGLHGGEELPAVHGLEVRQVPQHVEALRDDGVARHLHEVQARRRHDVARAQEGRYLAAHRRGRAVQQALVEFGCAELQQAAGPVQAVLLQHGQPHAQQHLLQLLLEVHVHQVPGQQQLVVHHRVRIILHTRPAPISPPLVR
mmetsp:Transcript_1936/g.3082  ORF Transcript_1936/g.3082 Transcript_1936/m.3082 type:complete len:202 (-) Transcript_1936:72-677(-)